MGARFMVSHRWKEVEALSVENDEQRTKMNDDEEAGARQHDGPTKFDAVPTTMLCSTSQSRSFAFCADRCHCTSHFGWLVDG
eukprot:scaffold4688_cov110-Skeletonema_marinoi.AAC.2